MSGIEDRLRDALYAVVDTVDAEKPRPFPVRRGRRPARPGRLVIPVCAVLAVLALVAGLLGIRKMVDEPDRRLQKIPTMPRFVFASYLAVDGRPSRVEVRDSRTGRLLDSEAAPKGTSYLDLAASGDGRTLFLLVTERGHCASTVRRFTVTEAGRFAGRWRVPGPAMPGTPVGDGSLAVTADGRRLAYSVESCAPDPGFLQMSVGSRIGVIDVGSGARTEWRESQSAADEMLSWSGKGDSLFFVRSRYKKTSQGDLTTVQELRALRVVRSTETRSVKASTCLRVLSTPHVFEGAVAMPDGRSALVIEGTEQLTGTASEEDSTASPAPGGGGLDLVEISAVDGRTLGSVLRPATRFAGQRLMKGDMSGRYLITGYGMVELGRNRPAVRFKSVSGFYDLDW
ncbi:hypothetical protein [Actinomadura sp. GTD37]|uniref:hypothetical protein n=1 Tax=Actinomadura sp. GTD37 TaxID=1778030 RepID=UPI0035C09137